MGKTLTTDHMLRPRIYVACLAAYNAGILHGAWIDADQEPWTLYNEMKAVLAASPISGAEEHAIHDYEGFGGVQIAEYASIDTVSLLASFIVEHGTLGAALLEHFSGDLAEAQEAVTDRYHGAHSSLADYVHALTEETTIIPTSLRYYIDWQAMARDAEINGDLFTISTEWEVVHVFARF